MIVIMFGTDDAVEGWDKEDWAKTYSMFIKELKAMKSDPLIYIMMIPPLYNEGFEGRLGSEINNQYEINMKIVEIGAAWNKIP